jgi:hypothetical protein
MRKSISARNERERVSGRNIMRVIEIIKNVNIFQS